MIISHKFKFIFIKTTKSAGTSIEVSLSPLCEEQDVFTPIYPPSTAHKPRNYRGVFNPFKEIVNDNHIPLRRSVRDFLKRERYFNHICATTIKNRTDPEIWDSYYKFTVDRNPYEKVLSLYNMLKYRSDGALTLTAFFDSGAFLRALNYPYYTDVSGTVIVDKIMRYENLNRELATVFDYLNISFGGTLREREKGAYADSDVSYASIFSEKHIADIRKGYSAEFSLLDYPAY